jgi:SAM-dependent methyltransferase
MFLRLRKSRVEPLPLTMTGVRMGERLLQIGVDTPALTGTLAAKVGLSGNAAHVTTNESDASRIREAAAKASALVDVRVVSTLRSIPFDDDAFDLIVIHSMHGLLAGMAPYTRVRCLEEAHRVLRTGGRLIVIEAEPRGGLGGLFRTYPVDSHYAATGETIGALKAEGFKPVRILGDREGYRFVEGLKT